jgi:hypothetical protein
MSKYAKTIQIPTNSLRKLKENNDEEVMQSKMNFDTPKKENDSLKDLLLIYEKKSIELEEYKSKIM